MYEILSAVIKEDGNREICVMLEEREEYEKDKNIEFNIEIDLESGEVLK